MKIIKNNKILIITLIIIFLIGIISVISIKFNKKNEIILEQFDVDNTKENNVNNLEKNIEDLDKKEIYIHIIGEVNNEGLIILYEGQRIADAIEKAGGVTNMADLSKINLAYVLSDGQKIKIPNINENTDNFEYVIDNSGDNIIVNNDNKLNKEGKKVNINTATQTELETLNGIGPSTAAKIIEYRDLNGKFKTIDDLKNVNGIGNSRFDEIKNNIVVK